MADSSAAAAAGGVDPIAVAACDTCSDVMVQEGTDGWGTTQSTDQQPEEEEFRFEDYLWINIAPVIFVFGMIGNILIMLVMRRRRMWGSTASVFLFLIALADACTLVAGMIPEWLEYADILVFKELHPATCKLEKFIFYTAADTAIWLLLAFTTDRFLAVVFPLYKRKICLISRAYMSALFILCLAVVKNFHVFWTRGPEYATDEDGTLYLKKNCGRPTAAYKNFEYNIRPWIVFALVNVIPFVCITAFNAAIIGTLVLVSRKSKTLDPTQGSGKQAKKTYSQTTVMCIAASMLFLVCITPSIVILIGRPSWQHDNTAYDVSKAISNQVVYLNHSLNIVLYCMTGKRFREELIAMFRRKESKQYQAGAQSGYSVRVKNNVTSSGGEGNGQQATKMTTFARSASPRFDSEDSRESSEPNSKTVTVADSVASSL